MILALLLACMHPVELVTLPPGAEVRIGDRAVGVTPVVIEVPLGRKGSTARVVAPGYRPMTVRLNQDLRPRVLLRDLARPGRWGALLGLRPRRHELILVRRHGRAGTWAAEEATPTD